MEKTLVRFPRTEEHLRFMANPSSDHIDVTYVADLARLKLSPEETATFQKQLSDVLGYVSQLKEVDVSRLSLLGDPDLENRLRADAVRACLSVADALANAPKQENNLFVVPKIVE
jgi:aspartyl-tRNA(Asn)/glutamyl-tRNA(Gln) amidotransferase subunit C